MPAFIVVPGILTALAGFAALGLGIQNWAFGIGNTLIASGTIASVGGLLLVGLGLVLRSLRMLAERIDKLTPAVAGEFQVPLAPQDLPLELEAPLPAAREAEPLEEEHLKPTRDAAQWRDEQLNRVHEVASRLAEESKPAHLEIPEPGEIEQAPPIEPPASASVPPPQGRDQGRGRSWPPRTATRLEEAAKKKKDWPFDRPRVTQPPRTAPPPTLTPVLPDPAPAPTAVAPTAAVMRSGIISGMAYTLYADGSIEAELPLGTVRFASVEELRAHVARTGTDADAEFGGRTLATS